MKEDKIYKFNVSSPTYSSGSDLSQLSEESSTSGRCIRGGSCCPQAACQRR